MQLAWLSLAMFFGMTPWFSATAANAPLVAEFHLSSAETAWLTMAVQGGFVIGTLPSALLNLPDVFAGVWGVAVVADSAQLSALVAQYSERDHVGTALTVQMCAGFLLTMASIRLLPVVARTIGWQWLFICLVPGPIGGVLALRGLVDAPRPQPPTRPHKPLHVVDGHAARDGLLEAGQVAVNLPGHAPALRGRRDDERAPVVDADRTRHQASSRQTIEDARERRPFVGQAAMKLGDRRRRRRGQQGKDVRLALGQAMFTQIGEIQPDPVRRPMDGRNQPQRHRSSSTRPSHSCPATADRRGARRPRPRRA